MHRLIILWRAVRLFISRAPVPSGEPPWGDRDAESLRQWLNGEHGQRFTRLLLWQEHEVCRRAVIQRGNAEYASGYAAGYCTAAAIFQTLAVSGEPESATQHQPGLLGGKDLAETLAP